MNGGYNDKKSRYTAHQISGRKSLAISLMKLCTGSVIQKPSLSAFSAPLADSATGAAQPQSLSAAALCFISDIHLWLSKESRQIISYRTLVRQVILTYCSKKGGCRFRQPPFAKVYHLSISDLQILQKTLNICCSSLRSVCQQSVIRQQRRVQNGFDTHSHAGAGCNYLFGICTVATVIIALCFYDVVHLVDQRHKVRIQSSQQIVKHTGSSADGLTL